MAGIHGVITLAITALGVTATGQVTMPDSIRAITTAITATPTTTTTITTATTAATITMVTAIPAVVV